MISFSLLDRGEKDEIAGRWREVEQDEGRRLAELELVDGTVTTAAAAALGAAATKAKVSPAHNPQTTLSLLTYPTHQPIPVYCPLNWPIPYFFLSTGLSQHNL